MTDIAKIRAHAQAILDLTAELPTLTEPEPVGPSPLCWGAKVSVEFRARVRQTAIDFGLDRENFPNWLMACMAFETGRTFSPSKKNPNSSATGLIQFMEKTARDEWGMSTADLAKMTAEKQFDYVWLYFRERIREKGPITRLSDCYMAILNPSMMGKPDSAVMWVKGDRAYAVNAGLDANKDHQITKAEAAAKVHALLAEGFQPENVA